MAGTDFITVTGANVTVANGDASGSIPVLVLPDDVPELAKKFIVQLSSVELASPDVVGNPNYVPLLGSITMATVVIAANDNPYGLFTIYSSGPLTVNTKQQNVVQLFVGRQG